MKRTDLVSRMTRRESLQKAAAFLILPAGLARGYAANEKFDVGVIGLAGMGVKDAVDSPRIHFENDLLSVEAGFDAAAVEALARQFPRVETWEERNLFFGGVHSVLAHPCGGRFEGAGDPRRGGVAVTV